jgi:GDPmannose 4,6-dehydratase
MKTACITGITGQCGSRLASKLLNENYKVYGMIRKSSSFNTARIDHIFNHPNLKLSYGDLSDTNTVYRFVGDHKPDYFFNLGAMSHVKSSFELGEFCYDVDGTGVLRCLEAIRLYSPETRFLQASTSELFGGLDGTAPQNEDTPMAPQSPYGIAKLCGYWTTKLYRQSYNLFAVNSISFNHESRLRSPVFITMKVVKGLCDIKKGLQKELVLGNLKAKRSWNHIDDIINGMLLIINAEKPDDYVIGDNPMITVEQFVEKVANKLQLNWQDYVRVDEKYYRPSEVNELEPDSSKLKALGWKSRHSVDDIIDEMIEECMKNEK